MGFINLGTRNKGTFWEYLSAYSFARTELSGSKFSVDLFLGLGRGISNQHCHHGVDIEKNSRIFKKEFDSGLYNNNYFKNLIKLYVDEFVVLKKICVGKNFKLLSNEQLADDYARICWSLASPNLPMLQGLYTLYLNDFFERELFKVLKREERNNEVLINEIKALLLTSQNLSITDKEEIALYKLRKIYKSKFGKKGIKAFLSDVEVKNKIRALVNEFGWFHMEYSQKPFTYEEYKKHLRNTVADSSLRKSPVQIKLEIKIKKIEFFKSHKNSEYLKNLSNVLSNFAFILDHTKAVVVEGRFLALPLFREIAKRLGISKDDLLFLVPPEVIEHLMVGKRVDRHLIGKRKTCRAVILRNKIITWYEGKEAEAIEKKYLSKENIGKIAFLKGVSAFPGKVRGRAIIIKSISDRKKFRRGDIMVSHDGSAELTIFLKEAGAIVTNEGGIICHAAIVAREMKTPCIVGTKSATDFIKDGDIIEVDANAGIVRKI